MSRPAKPDAAGLLLAIAAGRLALHLPEAGLAPLAAPLDAAGSLPDALALAEDALLAALAASDTPLARLARTARLSAFDLDLLGLAVLPALDDRAAEAVEALSRGARRLTAGRATRLLLPASRDEAALRRALRDSPLWQAGLLRASDPAQPPAERRLDPTPTLLAALDGDLPEVTAEGWLVQRVPAAKGDAGSLAPTVATLRDWATQADAPLLLLDSARVERAAEALALAGPTLLLHPPQRSAAPLPPPWAEAGALAAASGGFVVLLGEGEALPGPSAAPIAPVAVIGAEAVLGRLVARRHLRVPRPLLAEQRARWRQARPDLPEAEATALAAQGWMSEADIAAIAAAARAPEPAALLAARMEVAPPRGARLAMLRDPQVAWDRLVVDPVTQARLEEVVRRTRHRAIVREAWGMDAGGSALVALLTGDPGTGKTLAAEAVALRLGLPLLAADLSRIVSKYIGETEKNLSELFAAAEGFSAVLFFDEADALFGKRTAVQDAHDRYANIEVNYLLQRLERFDGVALLATNLAEGMDEAFLRRFDLTIPFRRPNPAQRLALWRAHLPAALLAPGLDLAALAASCDVTGGEIRNAALTAAYAAAEAGERIGARLLHAALAQEFAKAGRPVPHALAVGG
ncbi:ATP-binding protein [Roseomonas sp. AR75]|uniref:AAA family ATPase n=1 Tax=Roseomonas sp. AR75 TaxID=2562311 RepID=UPI0010BFBDCB|nr:ATP-binding protein [Roseomonas sp. AR75]